MQNRKWILTSLVMTFFGIPILAQFLAAVIAMLAKKTGPFGPVLFISEITISPDQYARYDRRTL